MTTTTQPFPVEVHTGTLVAPPAHDDPKAWNEYFEELYRDAAGEPARIPWADERPSASLVLWLNQEAPGTVRPGASVMVVGCGLGDDVRELAARGYDPIGFDVSPTAIAWCRQRFPDLADRFHIADVFAPPATMLRRADLVVEVNTLQSVHPALRSKAAAGVASLARPRGIILAICRGRCGEEAAPTCPPFAMTPGEFTEPFARLGWVPMRSLDDFEDDEVPPRRRLRVALKRGDR